MPKMKLLYISKLVKWEERDILTVEEEVALVEEEAAAESAMATTLVLEEEEDNEPAATSIIGMLQYMYICTRYTRLVQAPLSKS